MSQIEFDQLNISIHALTRSATLQRQSCICQEIFQSTHSRGVRLNTSVDVASLVLFQSTHSRGVRPATGQASQSHVAISIHALTRSATAWQTGITSGTTISIHALTRSATSIQSAFASSQIYFNPRTHEECDLVVDMILKGGVLFQSTHSRGVRLMRVFQH